MDQKSAICGTDPFRVFPFAHRKLIGIQPNSILMLDYWKWSVEYLLHAACRWRFCFIICLGLSLEDICHAGLLNYSGGGMVTYQVHSPENSTMLLERKYDFQFGVRGERWQIRVQEAKSSAKPTDIAAVWLSFDGTNIYEWICPARS